MHKNTIFRTIIAFALIFAAFSQVQAERIRVTLEFEFVYRLNRIPNIIRVDKATITNLTTGEVSSGGFDVRLNPAELWDRDKDTIKVEFYRKWSGHWNSDVVFEATVGRDGKSDTGIDLVAERLDGTGFVAIQCKCYDPDTTIQKSHIDSFLAASGKKGQFVGRMIVSSTPFA